MDSLLCQCLDNVRRRWWATGNISFTTGSAVANTKAVAMFASKALTDFDFVFSRSNA